MRTRLMPRITATGLASVLFLAAAGGEASIASADQPSVSISNPYYNEIKAPVLKPSWTYSITELTAEEISYGNNIVAAKGKVVVLDKEGKLTALQAKTGKKLWSYGSGMAPLLTYSSGTIYGMNKKGAVVALSEQGQKKWSAALNLKDADHLQLIDDTLYVTAGLQFAAVDAGSGKIKWKTSETDSMYSSGYPQVLQSGNVVIRSYVVQGALSAAQINAYDARTGKKLWEHFKQAFPLTVKDGLVYSITDEYIFSDDPVNRKVEVSVFNLQTGESKGTRVYPWKDSENTDGSFQSGGSYNTAFLDGNDFYVFQRGTLAKYDFWKYSNNPQPVQKWDQQEYEDRWPLHTVYDGKMFYQDQRNGGLIAMKLANGQYVSYDLGNNPTVQADIIGKGVYVGQSDGIFHAFHLNTFKPVFTLKTGSRQFGPTIKADGMVYVQSGGKLYAVKLPASLK